MALGHSCPLLPNLPHRPLLPSTHWSADPEPGGPEPGVAVCVGDTAPGGNSAGPTELID